jgi:uncharacterized protein (DUF2062 family)
MALILIPSRKIQAGTTLLRQANAILRINMNRWLTASKSLLIASLQAGISPQRLALTLALGFAIGCLPVIGIPTALCVVVAIALRLNVPAIQAANYLAMPLQLVLILPFVRMGGWMFSSGQKYRLATTPIPASLIGILRASGNVASHTLAAWLVIAGPSVLLLTLALTPVLQRVPALASERAE